MKHYSRLASLALILCMHFASAQADFYQGIRQMGMGGAAVAVVNDETALLLNPTGLGRLREPYVTLIDPEVTTNSKSVSVVQSLNTGAIDTEKIYAELAGKLDQRYFMRAQFFPSFADRNYGLGFLMKYDVTATRLSSNQFLDLNYISDWAAVGGYNKSFYGGVLKVGVAGRVIDRVQSIGTIDPAVAGLDVKTIGTEGLGVGVDVAASVSSPTQWLPTLSFIAKDIGDTSFTMSKGTRGYPSATDPNKIPMTMDVAMALFPIWNRYTRGTFTVQYDNLANSGTTEKKLHVGAEVNFADHLFLRAGWNRGYLTSGLEWSTQFFQLQLAYYGEEIGTAAAPIQDERYALKLVFRF